jgi:hypothetical protein
MLCINLKRDCSGTWLFVGFRPLFRFLFCYLSYLLGLATRRMFRLCGESLIVVDWIGLLIIEQVYITIGYVCFV